MTTPTDTSTDIETPVTNWRITYERLVPSTKAAYRLNMLQFVSVTDKVEHYVGTYDQIMEYLNVEAERYLADHYASIYAVNMHEPLDYLRYSNKGELIKYMDTEGIKVEFNN